METTRSKSATDDADSLNWMEIVRQQVASLRFGVIQITVHDSRVTQVETTERVRFEKRHAGSH